MSLPTRLAFPRRRYARRGSERGQTLVLVALAVVALIALVALGIDLIRLYDARSEAQNAADHAATTASHAVCRLSKTPANAMTDGYTVANENGFEQSGADTTVAITWGSGTRFTAVATKTIDTSFAGVIGIQTLDASATAVGECTTGGAGGTGAIYAGGTCEPGKGLEFSGSNFTVTGSVHTNADLKIAGSDSDFDEVTYVDDANISGSNIMYAPGTPPYPRDVGPGLPSPQWPVGWRPEDVPALLAQYKTFAQTHPDGHYLGTGTPPSTIDDDGVWYTESTNDWDVTPTGSFDVVLISANGKIKVSNGGVTLTAYDHPSLPRDGLLMLGNKPWLTEGDRCSQFSVQVSGQYAVWQGILWAPWGLVEFSGSDNSTGDGAIVAWGAKLSGQYISINYDPSLFTGTPEVLLLE